MPAIYFTSTAEGVDDLDREALSLVDRSRAALAELPSRFTEVDDPDAADFVLFVEPPRHKFESYGAVLSENAIVRRFAERCYAYDWADGPAGFLPGVYPSIRRSRWEPGRLVPGGFLHPYNEAVASAAADGHQRGEARPKLLMSFRGAASHPVRASLMDTRSVIDDPEVDFSLGDEWFTHSRSQKRDHVERLLSAKFALCPRGVGPATFRIYEAMALCRAPVIVSDEWIGPAGPDWTSCALVISESRIADLPDIVREREAEWETLGRAARDAWEQFFAHPVAVIKTVEAVERISLARARGETLDELAARWSSRRFKAENGWAKTQRLKRLASSPQVRARLRDKLLEL